MIPLMKISFLLVFSAFSTNVISSRVLELSDRFLDIHKDGQWLVMMYAPWCAHCKRLEPIWAHVAQHLHATNVRIGRIDCTRFTNVAKAFNIKGYPTILFVNGEERTSYNGDKTREEIVKFAQRMNGPPVQEITKTESFNTLKRDRDLYFLYVGEKIGPMWEAYNKAARSYQPLAFFYNSHPSVVKHHVPAKKSPFLVVYKENSHYNYSTDDFSDPEDLDQDLDRWVNSERFPTFPKVTRANIHQLYVTNKNLVIAVVEENQLEEVPNHMIEFRDMVESVIKTKRDKYHDHFQFGWTAHPELINSMAMMVIPLPNLVVINTSTAHHHFPGDEVEKLTPHVIELFLEQVRNETAPKYGGSGWLVAIGRIVFEIRYTVGQMWSGNPVLTLVLFGLPTGFLSLICYGICCPDIMDADDEEDDNALNHMKND